MKQSLISIIIFFAALTISNAQEESKFGVKFSGFVKSDIIWDSRQGVSAREGHFYLYPMNENLDERGEDINAKSNFNMLSIQTRLRALATGPDVWGAKSSAFVEGAFFGAVEGNINTFRLRHAFVKLAWTKTQLLVGQYWHPMFNVRCFPGTVSFNTGAPFQPFSRNPQVRLTQSFGKFNFTLTALAQRDFTSTGPFGGSTVYLRNTGYPAFNGRLEYFDKNDDNGNEFLAGFSFNYKALTPRIVTTEGYKTSETAMSGAFSGYLKYKSKDFTIQFNGFYGGDAYNLTMLGGYAVSDTSNISGKLEEYECIRNFSLWTDMQTNGDQFQFGLFAGYSQNLGSSEDIAGDIANRSDYVYTRGADIDYLYRISPRVIYNSGKFRIAPEIEYTVAAYATKVKPGEKPLNIDSKGKVTDSKTVGNIRFLLAVYFFF